MGSKIAVSLIIIIYIISISTITIHYTYPLSTIVTIHDPRVLKGEIGNIERQRVYVRGVACGVDARSVSWVQWARRRRSGHMLQHIAAIAHSP